MSLFYNLGLVLGGLLVLLIFSLLNLAQKGDAHLEKLEASAGWKQLDSDPGHPQSEGLNDIPVIGIDPKLQDIAVGERKLHQA